MHDLLALGRRNPEDASEPFNMAYLAIHGSGAVNGVSRLHGCVSRHIFAPLFPRWPEEEVPVGHVTNGVHMPSWDSDPADKLWMEYCGKGRWLGTMETIEGDIRRIPDERLWQLRTDGRAALVEFARRRLSAQLATSGASQQAIDEAKHFFDSNVLTLGFARRFATYKRPNLLLYDPIRLLRLLADPARPVQLFIAGKAHPEDREGQLLIQQWVRFIRQSQARFRVAFLSDYDMLLTEKLVQGVDVWINTPRRPWEASGTSGMKVLVNGGVNLSELDGWWAEAYSPEVGWALGDGKEHGDDPAWDAAEAEALYDLLEHEVIPEFYARDANGVPTAWVARMRESMGRLAPEFSANRTVREYTENYYLPAAATYRRRAADRGAAGAQIVAWQRSLQAEWTGLRIGKLTVEKTGEQNVFEVQVYLDELDPGAVQVELYADPLDGDRPVVEKMAHARPLVGTIGGHVYRAAVAANRPASDYTPRIVPAFADVAIPLEASPILWQH